MKIKEIVVDKDTIAWIQNSQAECEANCQAHLVAEIRAIHAGQEEDWIRFAEDVRNLTSERSCVCMFADTSYDNDGCDCTFEFINDFYRSRVRVAKLALKANSVPYWLNLQA